MATNSSYDTLSIRIEADSSSAQSSVAKLTQGLTNLETVAKNLDLNAFKKVQKILQDISKIDFSNVSKGLDSVAKSFQAIAKSSSRKIKDNLTGAINTAKPQVDAIETETPEMKPFNAFSVGAELNKVDFANAISSMNELGKTFLENTKYSTAFGDTLKNLKTEIWYLAGTQEDFSKSFDLGYIEKWKRGMDFSTATQSVNEYNATVSEVASSTTNQWYESLSVIEKIKIAIQTLGSSFSGSFTANVEKAGEGFKKLATQFTRIMRYRIIRKVIQEIYKGLVEGLNRMAMFDNRTNMAISNIKASLSNLTSSIGTVVAPILTALEPILTTVIDLVAKLFNSIGNLFSALQGGAIIKSQKQWEDYAKTLKKTTSISIDELNIIGDQQKTYYIKVEGLEQVSELADSLSNIGLLVGGLILAFGVDWKKAIKSVGDMIGTLSTKIKSLSFDVKGLGIALIGVVTTASSFVSVMANGLNWNNLITMIGGVTIAVIGLQKAFHNLNTTLIGGAIGGLIMLVSAIVDIIRNGVNAQNVILGIIGALTVAITGFALMFKAQITSMNTLLTTLKTNVMNVATAFATLVVSVVSFIATFKSIQQSWGDMSIWQKLLSIWSLLLIAIGTFVSVVGTFTGNIPIAIIGGSAVAVGTMVGMNVPKFAEGGFPEDGLFMANHGELVGQFSNGRTAVANNEQITEGIYQAVRDAMKDSGENGNIVIEMDGYKVAQGVTKRQNNMQSFVRGGNLVYGK